MPYIICLPLWVGKGLQDGANDREEGDCHDSEECIGVKPFFRLPETENRHSKGSDCATVVALCNADCRKIATPLSSILDDDAHARRNDVSKQVTTLTAE